MQNENWRDGAKVGIHMMLQEDLQVPIASQMALYATFKYAMTPSAEENGAQIPWDPQAPPPQEEPEDDVKIRVDYLPTDYTDDHFDLKKKEHLIGKTLVRTSQKQQSESAMYKSLELLGWTLFEKWDNVLSFKAEVSKDCLDKAKEIVNAAELEQKESVLKHLEGLKESSLDTEQALVAAVKDAVKEHEPTYIQTQVELFSAWEQARETEMKKQLAMYNRESRIDEISRRKKEFEEREKKLFFFERQEEFEAFREDKILEWKKKLPPRTWSKKITYQKKEVVSDSYVPPEV